MSRQQQGRTSNTGAHAHAFSRLDRDVAADCGLAREDVTLGFVTIGEPIRTLPDTSLTRHDPQVPERQALSMKTPASSATSRIVAPTGTGAVVSEV